MTKKRHIAFVANSSWYIYNLRIGIIRALQKVGVEVTVIAPKDSYTPKLLAANCHFIPLKMDNKSVNPLKDIGLCYRFLRIFRKHSFDYIFTYTIKPNIYGAIAAKFCNTGNTTILSGRGYSALEKGGLNFLVEKLYKLSIRFSQQIWFVNRDDFQHFTESKLVQPEKCKLLPGEGVDTEYFAPRERINDDTITFLFSGRLIWSKGVGYYINAAKYIQQKYPHTCFKLLGYFGVQNPDAIQEKQIEQWNESGIIDYLGFTQDVRPFLAKTDCFVLPSYYGEGTPRSLLEATSMEIPIITTDSVGCREIVKNKVNGFLCKPKDEMDLINKIELFLSLTVAERLEMGRIGRVMAIANFDEKLVIQHYLELILAKKKGNYSGTFFTKTLTLLCHIRF